MPVTTKKSLKKLLNKGDVEICFVKKDGTNRRLVATNNVPVSKVGATEAVEGPDHLIVFDKQKQEWRTVIVDSIYEVNVL